MKTIGILYNPRIARAYPLAEEELATGVATVRDMQAGEQTSVRLAELVEWLKARVGVADLYRTGEAQGGRYQEGALPELK